MITTIFMATLSRPPREEERTLCHKVVAEAANTKEGYEDVLWALINSKQFVYIH